MLGPPDDSWGVQCRQTKVAQPIRQMCCVGTGEADDLSGRKGEKYFQNASMNGLAPSNPSQEFYVTTVWTSLSGSAAFASRATGYPLGYVATKLSLGYALTEVQNPMCRGMTACYEPCLDYCAIRYASRLHVMAELVLWLQFFVAH